MNPEALIGVELGNSVVQRLLGRGTMGTVYLAHQAGHQVAIKIFSPAAPLATAHNEIFQQRLEELIARGAALNHPHILAILSHGRYEQLVYQITPYIAGESLETLFARAQPLPFARVQQYLEQLASALDYAHARGIIHGDVKASNILLTPTEDVFLSDFCLASLTLEKEFASTRQAKPGMLHAIAPEYVLAQTPDQRADVYALGAVLYQMVTGVPPFEGETLGDVAIKHVRLAPPAPSSRRKDLPQAAEQVILRALAKQPAERYSHARDLVSAFRLALEASLPAPAEKTALQALNILAGTTQNSPEATLAPRTGGLFDPKWRAQASLATLPGNPPSALQEETSQPVHTGALEEDTLVPTSPPDLPAYDQPTHPIPQVQNADTSTETRQPCAQAISPAQENAPLPGFTSSVDGANNIQNGEFPGQVGFQPVLNNQADFTSSPQNRPYAAGSTLQLADMPASNTEGLQYLPSQPLFDPVGIPGEPTQETGGQGEGTGMIKLGESAKIVNIPVAGQPGRFVTGYLPTHPAEPTEPTSIRKRGSKMKIVSLILAIMIVAAGSGLFLTLRSHNNQAGTISKTQATSNAQTRATAQASATTDANIIFSDDLSQNSNHWPTGSLSGYTCAFENGAYHVTNQDKVRSASILLPDAPLNGPFTYTLTMEQVKGDLTSSSNLFGMILYATVQNPPGKPQVDTFYAFEIQNNAGGQYQFWKYDNSKNTSSPWNELWTKNFGKEFKQGSGPSHVNTVKIIATGKMFTFIVNNKQVGTWKDHSFSSGTAGMLVNLDGAEVAFSHLLLTHS
jgi:serine/threonine protein kinase